MKKRFLLMGFVALMLFSLLSGCATNTALPEGTPSVQTETTTKPQEVLKDKSYDLEVHFIDVGQADAALLISDGRYMLIDGGNAPDSNLIYSYLNRLNINYLDYMIGTHAHEDHIGGLPGALQKADVGTVYVPKTESNAKFYQNFKDKLSSKGISSANPTSGTTFEFGSCSVQLFCPQYESSSDLNNTSIMTKVQCGNISFLFTGDAEYDEEHDILNQGYDLSATVLKAGHHGSDTSSSYSFLRKVMPEYVVISVGKDNQYGHPHDNALSRFRDVGAKTYRTDLQGDIIFKSDGNEISVTTQRNENVNTNPTIADGSEWSEEAQTVNEVTQYIGNKNTKKLHRPECSSVSQMNESNKDYLNCTRDEAISKGYEPCKRCNP